MRRTPFGKQGRSLALGFFVLLAACQGSMGTTPPINPMPQNTVVGGQNPQSAMQAQTVSANATATWAPSLPSLDFPTVGGFSLTIALHSPSPSPSPSVLFRASRKSAKKQAAPKRTPTPAPTQAPTPSEEPTTPPKPFAVDLSLTTYPNDVPPPPTPLPSMSPIPLRHAILRAEMQAHGALTLPSLDAFAFTLPKGEHADGRGFSILIVEELKHKKTAPVLQTTHAVFDAAGYVRAGGLGLPIPLTANHRYAVILYGDYILAALTGTPPPAVTPPAAFASPGAVPSGSQAPWPAGGLQSPHAGTPLGGGILVH